MSQRKHRLEDRSPQEMRNRKIKLAEGGILFVLVFGVCVYLGIRYAHEPLDESGSAAMMSGARPTADSSQVMQPAVVMAPEIGPPDAPLQVEAAGLQTDSSMAVESPSGSDITHEIRPREPVTVTYTRAEKTYFEGRYSEAAEMFATYCGQHPGNTWGHYMRGLSLWKAGRCDEAHGAFETALRLQPDHLKSLINLARVELELAEPHAALATIERALDVAPRDAEALRVLGRVYHQIDRPDEAISTYLQALNMRTDDPWTLNNLGLIYIEQEAFDRALPVLARACELAPETGVIRNNLGTALEKTGHMSQALTEFEHALVLGSSRGQENFVRLDSVVLPSNDAVADLKALASAWRNQQGAVNELAVVAPDGRPDHEP
jgi:tetratricopeptide (TPR) repeat protein